MSIRHKLIFGFAIGILCGSVLLVGFSTLFIYSGFQNIEDSQAKALGARFQEALKETTDAALGTAVQFSSWDDTYNYILNRNREYIKVNYESDAIYDAKYNRILIADQAGQVIYCQDYDLEQKEMLSTCTKQIQDQAQNYLKSITFESIKKGISGLFLNSNQVVSILTISPVVKSDNSGAPRGYFLTMKHLDEGFRHKYISLLKAEIQWGLKSKDSRFEELKRDVDYLTTRVASLILNTGDVLVAELVTDRSITKQGRDTIYVFSGFSVGALILMMSFALWIFLKNVVSPIVDIKKDLQGIASTGNLRERVKLQRSDEIGALTSEINTMLEKLEESSRALSQSSKFSALGQMSGQVAHEINNPLSVIMAYSARISKNHQVISRDELGVISAKIHATSVRISKIVQSLRLVSRGGEQDPFESVGIKELWSEVMALSEMKFHTKDIRLILDGFDQSAHVHGRTVQLIQVFLNLLGNAVDAIEGLHDKWIRVESQIHGQRLVVRITDSGAGVDPAQVERLMEPFFTTKAPGKGTGLGLSITKSIIEGHGGTLRYISESKNTAFEFTLPLAGQ